MSGENRSGGGIPPTERRGRVVRLLLAAALAAALAVSCARPPLRVGVSLVLTGLSSRIGVTGRNGIELAAAEINAAGGIRGRPVELLVRDDLDSPEGGLAADRKLAEEGVPVIIGHMSSRSGSLAIPFANERGIVLLSPTISSTDWSGRDDWFFRLIGTNDLQGEALAAHALASGIRRAVVTYEYTNRSYSKKVADSFAAAFAAGGGSIDGPESFAAPAGFDYARFARGLLATAPEAILAVAGPVDTARLCQELDKLGSRVPVYAGMWATTDDLVRNGGGTVERVHAAGTMDLESREPAFAAFRAAYAARYGEDPTFASMHGYESLRFLAAALERDGRAARRGDPASIRRALLAAGPFQGLHGELSLDGNGDCGRPYMVFSVREGRFVREP